MKGANGDEEESMGARSLETERFDRSPVLSNFVLRLFLLVSSTIIIAVSRMKRSNGNCCPKS